MYKFNRYLTTFSISTPKLFSTTIITNTHKAKQSKYQNFYINSLINSNNISHIKQVHAIIIVDNMLNNLNIANKLLYLYAKFKSINDVYKLFNTMNEKNPVTWSVLIGGYVKNSDYIECLRAFREFLRCGFSVNSFILPYVIRVCRDLNDMKCGILIHQVVCKNGLLLDSYVGAVLIDMYGRFGQVDNARKVFDEMSERDVVTWTVMIGAYGGCGDAREALVLFDKMREEGVVPDKFAVVNVVDACARVGAMYKARELHEYVISVNMWLDVVLGTAMIDMYAKCGSVGCARDIFDTMIHKNVVTWSAMMAAYGYHGMGQKAIDLFHMMLDSGVSPNKITFVSLLYACSHSGLVEDGLRIFSLMKEIYSLDPDVKHYTCMVDLLGRAGKLDEAMKLIDDAPIKKDAGLWSALLGACRIHVNSDIAEKAAKSLIELQPQNAGHYVLLSNIYAKDRKWQEVAKVRELMNVRKLKKISGQTCIEIDDKIYQFSVGTTNHPRSDEIYRMLNSLKEKLESSGYVPDTSFVLQDVDDELKKEMLYSHSEKLAIAFGLIATPEETPIRITKNLRVCGDCHTFIKLVSAITKRVIIARDANRFHQFNEGICSCGDYW